MRERYAARAVCADGRAMIASGVVPQHRPVHSPLGREAMQHPRHVVRPGTKVLAPVVLVLALVAVVVPGAGAAHAVDAWRVPDRATITLPGHGYGHGHGLSQYGAQGAARQGLGYRRIVKFYYPGTRWGQAAGKV